MMEKHEREVNGQGTQGNSLAVRNQADGDPQINTDG